MNGFRLNIPKRALHIIIILSIIALISSSLLLIKKNSASYGEEFCSIAGGDCDIVGQSKYAYIFGIDNAWFGVLGFLALIIMSMLSLARYFSRVLNGLILAGCMIAGVVAISFLYIQHFILYSYCIYCIIVDIASIILLIVAVYVISKKPKRAVKRSRQASS
jgi:uncharacterized membrane protein